MDFHNVMKIVEQACQGFSVSLWKSGVFVQLACLSWATHFLPAQYLNLLSRCLCEK